jgi:WD40 repeat protein
MEISPNDAYIATGNQDESVHFWFVETRRDLEMWGYASKVRELAWDARSRLLATGGSNDVVIWDMSGKGPEGSRPLVLRRHTALLGALHFQHRGSLLASGGQDGLVVQWSPLTRKTLRSVGSLDSPITALSWSPDDQFLIAGSRDGTIGMWLRS